MARIASTLIITFSAILVACTPVSPYTDASVTHCKDLVGTRLGAATIERAEPINRGEPLVGFFKRILYSIALPDFPALKAPVEFCRATARLQPVDGANIMVEVWLPPEWNGKLLGSGGGGFNGGLFSAPLVLQSPVEKGYAIVVTDAGHEVTKSAEFAYESTDKLEAWAYRANHVAVLFAKELVASYYGEPAKRAYFEGCSNGGRDALILAQRFPQDYDGIIVGAPAAAWSELMSSFAWNQQAQYASPGAPDLEDKIELVHNAVVRKCDALDGVADELLENPESCPFDPAELQCTTENTRDCLTANEVAALQKIYQGPRLSDGTQLYPGMPVGGETLKNWDKWIFPKNDGQGQFATEFFRWMVHRNPDWDISDFDLDQDYALAERRISAITDADDPDLTAFTNQGGRLLIYHGWNDAAIPAGATVNYYNAVRETLGSVAERHVRLFMIPGMQHCFGGMGTNDFDLLGTLDRWVESSTTPERIMATEYDPPKVFKVKPGAKVVRTRPLCPWPKVAQYNGTGSTDEAANFSCK